MEKVIRDGHVAVIISAGWGAGWSTWHYGSNREILIFHPKLVELVESGQHNQETVLAVLNELLDKEEAEGIYLGGVMDLSITWIPEGIKFKIEEYDGSEYVITDKMLNLTA
jgi:hypothetical protein